MAELSPATRAVMRNDLVEVMRSHGAQLTEGPHGELRGVARLEGVSKAVTVYPKRQVFTVTGESGGGNVVDFLMRHLRIDHDQAVGLLSDE